MIQIKRAYEQIAPTDGYRVLVDRLWPRGMSKEKEHLDLWLKEIAPSNELRKWFNHEADKFPVFKKKYLTELQSDETQSALQELLDITRKYPVITLVYSAKDEKFNNAVILKELLETIQSETT
ncbi:MarR family transcriptional regulator [Enterococcus ureilyticus]|uniref:MarR family transcriptional regulator n=1 Tax=Enterococcus ureilyticus TaxID=1131292 RepID=A0A1E5H984_9ENTE|nr:DUF488 domain-containing protein [Enterococcus ureilyticus]MBM7688398.1 uncharacterized protein YeaO (DUF488 family) [Enterococcus ureilyticus]MBO0447384.1 DUF488 domain-containing protein [Enterococcus ureilyticus]OEG21503.1 MarR family transcriptional regulator [Enterococcus ureilyticus]